MNLKRVSGRLMPALEWTEDLSGACARITATGSRSLRVENHTGVLDLSDTRVVVGSRQGALCVEGRDLLLCDVRPDALVIRGEIARIEFPCGGSGAR